MNFQIIGPFLISFFMKTKVVVKENYNWYLINHMLLFCNVSAANDFNESETPFLADLATLPSIRAVVLQSTT